MLWFALGCRLFQTATSFRVNAKVIVAFRAKEPRKQNSKTVGLRVLHCGAFVCWGYLASAGKEVGDGAFFNGFGGSRNFVQASLALRARGKAWGTGGLVAGGSETCNVKG